MIKCVVNGMQEKNVSTDMLEGKVGRMYMPTQDISSMALRKMKVRPSCLLLCTGHDGSDVLQSGSACVQGKGCRREKLCMSAT